MAPILFYAYLALLSLLSVYGMHRLWFVLRFQPWRASSPRSASSGVSFAAASAVADPVLAVSVVSVVDEPSRAAQVAASSSVTSPGAAAPSATASIVTVQLPIYNERTVAARLIRAAGRLVYPRARLELQVLDDSTDETRGIVDREVAALCAQGLDAKVLRRADRAGYKAGALGHGLALARGELVAIFDADFVPEPDFLLQLVPSFADPAIAMVQARWGHENRDDDLLTRAQATLLDGHFVLEHRVRHTSGLYFNFNGTAGLWRKTAIVDAGGWQHDTLTEDLDLSYRAQMRGWRFDYRPDVVAPAELPPDILAFKSQQHRWAKGSVQVARKLGPLLWRAPLPLRVKLEAAAHLTGNIGYPLVLAMAILLPGALPAIERMPWWSHAAMFCTSTLSVLAFYERGERALGRALGARWLDVPAAMALGIGMSVSQSLAVIEGWCSGTGVFVRTPKRGVAKSTRGHRSVLSYRSVLKGLPGLELVLAAWFAWALWSAVRLKLWGTLPFLLLFFCGFAWVGALTLIEWLRDHVVRLRLTDVSASEPTPSSEVGG